MLISAVPSVLPLEYVWVELRTIITAEERHKVLLWETKEAFCVSHKKRLVESFYWVLNFHS